MKPKYKLKPWVKTTLLLLPEMIIICQLFFVCLKLTKVIEATGLKKEEVEKLSNEIEENK